MAEVRLPIIRLAGKRASSESPIMLGNFSIWLYEEALTVIVGGYPPLRLTPTEYACFCNLLASTGAVLSDQRLRYLLVGTLGPAIGEDIEYHIDNLRRKIRQSGISLFILRVRALGYIMFAEVVDK